MEGAIVLKNYRKNYFFTVKLIPQLPCHTRGANQSSLSLRSDQKIFIKELRKKNTFNLSN